MELSEILAESENFSIEYKSAPTREVAKEIAAFASSRGGSAIIGVTDVDRTVIGLEEPFEDVREKVQNWVHEFVRPAPPYSVGKVEHGEHVLLVVAVEAGTEAAYAFKEKFYYRNNEQSQPMPASEIARRFSEVRLAIELKKLTEWVGRSRPQNNVAAGITGQGELATLNYGDLFDRLLRDLKPYLVIR